MECLTAQLGQLDLQYPSTKLDWLDNSNITPDDLTQDVLCEWLRTGVHDTGLIRPYEFCQQLRIDQLVAAQEKQAKFTEREKQTASKRNNPYELIGKHIFSTRTAMKCAELDALLKFTSPQRIDGTPLLGVGEMFTYADITNTDDFGVIEYIQWRKGRYATGYAFDIDSTDAMLWRHALPETRPVSHLVQRVAGVTSVPANIRAFIAFVRAEQPDGVHLAYSESMQMDDAIVGIRENIVKQQVLSYCALCLALLRPNGTMVVKVMETYTPFTVGLIYLLRQCFAQMCIVKCVSSRPTSGERYVVLRWCLPGIEAVVEHLLCTNESLVRMAATGDDITELVPLETLRADEEFAAYIVQSNDALAASQAISLERRLAAIGMPSRGQPNSEDMSRKWRMRQACLRDWNLPNFNDITRPKQYAKWLEVYHFKPFNGYQPDMDRVTSTIKDFSNAIGSLDCWSFAPVGPLTLNGPTFFLSMGAGHMRMWSEGFWMEANQLNVTLPEGTLVYGEVVDEYTSDGLTVAIGAKRLHVIHLASVEFQSMHHERLVDRRKRVQELERRDNSNVRMRPFYPVSELLPFVKRARLGWKQIQGSAKKCLMFKAANDTFYQAGGIAFFHVNKALYVDKKPFIWNWSKNAYDLLNKPEDLPTHFAWFEKRLATVQSQRPQSRDFPPRNFK